MVRREFLKKALAVPAIIATDRSLNSVIQGDNKPLVQAVESDSHPVPSNLKGHKHSKVKPRSLKDGSRVAFTAPASAASIYMVKRGIATFETFGCEVVIGDTIRKQDRSYKYLSASDQQRADELMEYIVDESIDAIICGRGGYGVMRILDQLDWDSIANNPKIIMGFSDITALVNPVFSVASTISFHGPVGYSSFNKFTTEYINKLLFNDTWENLPVDFSMGETIGNTSTVSGELVGGNLKLVTNLMGTPYEPDFTDKILFFEDVSEHPYKIDRMLTQLRLAGVFDSVRGILVGNIGPLDKKHSFKPYGSFTIRQVLVDLLGNLDKPVIIGLPFGHTKNNLTMPIGTKVSISTENMEMVFQERPVI